MSLKRITLVVGSLLALAVVGGVVQSQTERFELEGNLKFFGSSSGVIFTDGTKQTTARVSAPPCFDNVGRYLSCNNGTVTDMFTGLLWLQDPACTTMGNPEGRNYAAANSLVAALLFDGVCGLTDGSSPGDWRLPTQAEWTATIAVAVGYGCTQTGFQDPPSLTSANARSCYEGSSGVFGDVPELNYWSSTTTDLNGINACRSNLFDGTVALNTKVSNFRVWPVRSGFESGDTTQ